MNPAPRSSLGLGAVQRGACGALLRLRLRARGGGAAVLRLLAAGLVVPQLQGAAAGARRETLPQKPPTAPVKPSDVLDVRMARVHPRAGCQVTLLTPAANGLVCRSCSIWLSLR